MKLQSSSSRRKVTTEDRKKEIMEDGNHDLLPECDNENVTGNLNILDNENVGDVATVPKVGMTFNDEKEMFDFYKRYAYSLGFLVRKRNSKKGKDGVMKYVTFTCIHEGQRTYAIGYSFTPQPTSQTDCKARISASLDGRIWRINKVYLDHNHKTQSSKSRFYQYNQKKSVKRKLEMNDMMGIPLHNSFGGYDNTTFVEKDRWNYVEQARRLRLGGEDALAIQAYFSKMQARCSGFNYSMDLDDECRLKNVFWADNRCRQSYKEFGDVVTFDTTYLTNKYDVPFVYFVGVNHHGQSTLLGCGLLSNEDTETFVWLFRTWLECMHGQAPNGIIADQDPTIQNAIKIVFPNTKHRWCLWHIMKKLSEKFEYDIDKSLIVSAIHGMIYDLDDVQEFEKSWGLMLDKYKLHDNDWLSGLYKNRDCWVPCLLKTTFWAGMLTTQYSKGMNTFFDGYVHLKTSLKQFVEQYERALRNKVEKEFKADFVSHSQMVSCVTNLEMEKQFQSVYTISKFKEVQREFIGKVDCKVIFDNANNHYEVHELVEPYELGKKKTFSISFCSDTCELICSCHLFECRGIICRHAITLLIHNDIMLIPEKYIMRRWRRDVTRAYTRIAVNYDGLLSTPGQLRYDNMCQAFSEVANLVADDEGWTCYIMEVIKNLKEERPRARHSNAEEGLNNVQASQLPQCSISSPLQNFVLPPPTNVVVNVEGDRAADLHNLAEQPLSLKDDWIVSANPHLDSARSRAPENTKDQPATSVTSGALSTMYSYNAYNLQDQGISYGGYDDGNGNGDEHSNNVNVNNLHVMPPAMSNDNPSLFCPTGFGFDSQMAYGQFSPLPSTLSPTMFDGQLYSPHQMPVSSPYYRPPVSPGLPHVTSAFPVSQSELMPSEISGQQNPMDYAHFRPGSGVYVPYGAFGGGDISGSSGVGLYKFPGDFGSSESLPNQSSPFDTGKFMSPLAAGTVYPQSVGILGSYEQNVAQTSFQGYGLTPSSPARRYPHAGSYQRGLPPNRNQFSVGKGGRREKDRDFISASSDAFGISSDRNRGPRFSKATSKSLPGEGTSSGVHKDVESTSGFDISQFNAPDFTTDYENARFFVIKSFSEDNIHRSIKYNVWASTSLGNRKLDAAYREAKEINGIYPVFLFFSVNASGQFCGVAEMVGPVDFDNDAKYWQQDRWSGQFPVKWHIIKDVPNGSFRHIVLENNDKKPVTHSRDSQEVKLEQGIEMLKIFKNHNAETSLLDDFTYYDEREKSLLERKVKQQATSSGNTVAPLTVADSINQLSDNLADTLRLDIGNTLPKTELE